MSHHYVDDDHQIDRPGLWAFFLADEPLTDWDFSGDTQPIETPLEETLEALEDEPPVEDADMWEPDDL